MKLKNVVSGVFSFLRIILSTPIVIVGFFMHFMGLLVSVVLVAATIWAVFAGNTLAWDILLFLWVLYAGLGVLMFGFVVTDGFLKKHTSIVRVNSKEYCHYKEISFWKYLSLRTRQDLTHEMIASLLWPATWIARSEKVSPFNFMDSTMNVIGYWFGWDTYIKE